MFEDINEYIKKTKEERQSHLDLSSSCIEIGTNSYQCRALLAHELQTVLPKGRKILLCHACNNDKCSNPKHLYWGTSSENSRDAIDCGARKSIWEYTVALRGEEKAKDMQRERAKIGGERNKGTPKASEHRNALSVSLKGHPSLIGRKRITPINEIIKMVDEFGAEETAKKLNITLCAARNRYYKAIKKVKEITPATF